MPTTTSAASPTGLFKLEIGSRLVSAILSILRVAASLLHISATFLVLAGTAMAGYLVWDYYIYSPWTGDAHVQADAVSVASRVADLGRGARVTAERPALTSKENGQEPWNNAWTRATGLFNDRLSMPAMADITTCRSSSPQHLSMPVCTPKF